MTTSRSSRVALLCAGILLRAALWHPTRRPRRPQRHRAQRAERPCAQKVAQKTEKTAQKKVAKSDAAATHKVAIQVNQNDKAVMDLALNNVRNIAEYYKEKGETVAIEIVTYGPGLHMLRADTSPVKDRIAPMALENSERHLHRLRQYASQPEQGRGQARHADQRGQGRALGRRAPDGAAEAGLRLHPALSASARAGVDG